MMHSFYHMKQQKHREPGAPEKSEAWLYWAFASTFFFVLILFSLSKARLSQEALASRMAPDILRFHVLANSDRAEDQKLKLEVRQLLLDTIYQDLAPDSEDSEKQDAYSKEFLAVYIINRRKELEQIAEDYMKAKGFSYPAEIRLERCYFPTKQYGDLTFPCGTYDAVRVLLGEGAGKNWWCVLYPALCFSGISENGQVPETSRAKLEALLPEEDYRSLTGPRTVVFGDTVKAAWPSPSDGQTASDGRPEIRVRVSFRLTELLNQKKEQPKQR